MAIRITATPTDAGASRTAADQRDQRGRIAVSASWQENSPADHRSATGAFAGDADVVAENVLKHQEWLK